MQPNRIAVYLTAAAGLIGAVAVPIANLDISSTTGVVAGLLAIVAVVNTWLKGWQMYENNPAGGYPPKDPNKDVNDGPQPQKDTEVGDPHDALPHHAVTDPAIIPVDEIDYKR